MEGLKVTFKCVGFDEMESVECQSMKNREPLQGSPNV